VRPVSVAVVTFNTRDYLKASRLRARRGPRRKSWSVDNASSDDTADIVRREDPEVLNEDAMVTPARSERLGAYNGSAFRRRSRALLRHLDASRQRSYFTFPGTLGW